MCHIDVMNTTKVRQTHKASCPLHNIPDGAEDDTRWPPDTFDEKKPGETLLGELSSQTFWTASFQLATKGQKYMAISHMWSDSTSVGLRESGSVNS